MNMTPEMTERTRWLKVTGDNGVTYLDWEEAGEPTHDDIADWNREVEFPAHVVENYEGLEVDRVAIVWGYGVRLSGGLDDLENWPWQVFQKEDRAEMAFNSIRNDSLTRAA